MDNPEWFLFWIGEEEWGRDGMRENIKDSDSHNYGK